MSPVYQGFHFGSAKRPPERPDQWKCGIISQLAYENTPNSAAPFVCGRRRPGGPVIAKGTVVLRHGLIEAVGADVAVPPDAMVVEGEGLTVYPGLIDGLSTWGLPGAAPAAGTATREEERR